jgi:hypothetical protein
MDYKNGKIYKIIDNAYTKMYIGSTTQQLSKRFSLHKSDYIRWKNNKHNKITVFDIFEEFGVDNCKIELIEECQCENRIQLLKKEGEYIQNNNCVNRCIAGRTPNEYIKEYYQANKNKCLDQSKEYYKANKNNFKERYESNKDKILEQRKERYQANKDKTKEYYQANKDKTKEYYQANKDKMKEYYQANKDKIKVKQQELRAIKKANKEVIIE